MGDLKQFSGKIFCILCNGVVALRDGDKSRFIGHMNHEHEAFSGINFILAGCLMSEEERAAVEKIMEDKYQAGEISIKKEDSQNEANKQVTNDPFSSPSFAMEQMDNAKGKVKLSMKGLTLENKTLGLPQAIASKVTPKRDENVLQNVKNKSEMGSKTLSEPLYKCDVCDSIFKASKSLKRHRIKQHGDNSPLLKENVISFNNGPPTVTGSPKLEITPPPIKENDQLHLELNFCGKCDAKFKSQTFLDTHVKIAHPNPILMNVVLKKEAENTLNTEHNFVAQSVSSPQNKNDEKIGSNSCDTCGVAMKTVEALKDHLKNHIKVECDQKFTGEKSTANVSNIETLKTLKCDQCSKKFIMLRNLSLHKRIAHKNIGRKKMQSKLKFKCSPCKVKFMTKSELEVHSQTNHKVNDNNLDAADLSGGINVSKVTVNGSIDVVPETAVSKVEENTKVLKKIKIKKEPTDGAQFPCSQCPSRFRGSLAMKRHRIKRHGEVKCHPCDKTFKSKSEYFLHIKACHKRSAKSHKKSNVVESKNPSNFSCDLCLTPFNCKSSLYRHKQKEHKNKEVAPLDPIAHKNIEVAPLDPIANVLVNDASFIEDLKNKIMDDDEDNGMDNREISKVLDESAPTVDLSGSEYFSKHPTMIKPFSKKKSNIDSIIEDPDLPKGWFCRQKKTPSGRVYRDFITPDRKLIRTIDGMLEYMKVSNIYSEEDIESVSKCIRLQRPSNRGL